MAADTSQTVPYADARNPFQRKQAFDFGDGGAGICANNLELGCDCLGHIKVGSHLSCDDLTINYHPVLRHNRNSERWHRHCLT